MGTANLQRWLVVALVVAAAGYVLWDVVRTHEDLVDRYEKLNERIEAAMPKRDGIQPVSPALESPTADLTIELTTSENDGGDGARIEIRVEQDGPWTLPLPPADLPEDDVDAWWDEHAEPTFREVQRAVEAYVAFHDAKTGRIRTPRARGGLGVPPQVAIRILSILMAAGVEDVAMDGV